jgi:hypothetical protein
LPAPGTTLALAERLILPVFLPPSAPTDATPWAILSWGSALLHGMSRSLRHRSLDRRHLSWGSAPLQRSGRRESTSGFRRPPGFAGVSVHGSHPADYGAARRFSQPLSGLLPLSAVPPFSGGWRSCGSPYRGLFLSRSPARLVAVRPTLLTLLPRADLSPFLGGDTRRRGGSYLGAFIRRLLIVYRVFVLVKVDRTFEPFSQPILSDLPLVGFFLLMVCTRAKRGRVPPSLPSSFTSRPPSLASHPLPSTAFRSLGPTHSHEWTVPSQGFSPATASPVWRATRCGLIGLATFRLGPRYPVAGTHADLLTPI